MEPVRIDLDADGVLLRALHLHLRHAADHRDARRDHRLGVVVEHVHRHDVGGQPEKHDRLIRGIELAERRRRRHAGRQQRHHGGNRRLHVNGGAVDVAIEVELQRNVRAAGGARRGHLVEAGDGRELTLERARHRRGHGAGVAAGQSGADVQGREVDVRQVADAERAIRDDAEQARCRASAGWWRSAA